MSTGQSDCRDRTELEGRYTNYFEVGYNEHEFVFDFGQFYREGSAAQMHTRLITTTVHMKALLAMLQDAVKRHQGDYPEGGQAPEGGQPAEGGHE